MAKSPSSSTELQPIDRLEEKLKLLVGVVERLKAQQAKSDEENRRLKADLEALHTRLESSETLSAEVTSLREERDVIRTRVTDMLEQLNALDI